MGKYRQNHALTEANLVKNMKREALEKNILEQARRFKSRATESLSDNKRHDLVESDERKAMLVAQLRLGWSFAKIGSTFDRDPRTVELCLQREETIANRHDQYKAEMELHRKELSSAAFKISRNLERYQRNLATVRGIPGGIGDLPCGGNMYEMLTPDSGCLVELEQVKTPVALNLLSHLREDFLELADLKKWSDLTDNKITYDLIDGLRQKATRGDSKENARVVQIGSQIIGIKSNC